MLQNRLQQLATNDEGFCFDPRTGETYQLNETAQVVLTELKKGRTEAEVASLLVSGFGISHQEAETDTQEFLQLLKMNGIA
jgi:PqqD family protein of HPr-rel-A system